MTAITVFKHKLHLPRTDVGKLYIFIMISRSVLLALLATSCRSQYQMESDVRADITFNAVNDRFDVGNIIDEQKQAFNDMPSPAEDDWRRSEPLAEVLKHNRRRYQRGQEKISRRVATDFAHHDLMLDEKDYIDGQYDKNLEPLRIETKSQRRGIVDAPSFMYNKAKLRRKLDASKKPDKAVMRGLQNVVLNYLHGGKEARHGRRMSDTNPEDEILLHYAVPLSMKVKGFLELPQGSQIV